MYKNIKSIIFLSIFCFSTLYSQTAGVSRQLTQEEKKIKELEQAIESLQRRVGQLELKVSNMNQSQSVTSSQYSTPSTPSVPKPSNYDIEQAIKECLRKQVPKTWSGSLMGGRNGKVSNIQVIEMGIYNSRYRYWPVKAKVQGTCEAQFIGQTQVNSFNQVGDFKVSQDDYGNWTASLDQL